MARNHDGRAGVPQKVRTGVVGLDAATGGGLPAGRTTLIEGGPGAGKTVLALQSLVYGARELGEPGIFVAFEESSSRILGNAARFGWDLPSLQADSLFFLDAQPQHDMVHSGSIDLDGLLSSLDAKVREIGAKRIAFDAIDVILSLLDDAAAERRELYRLNEWLMSRGLTGIVTCKAGPAGAGRLPFGFMQFMVDCGLILEHRLVEGVSRRSLRVQKYRGSGFYENELSLVIGAQGVEVACVDTADLPHAAVSEERVSSGVSRLDTMLGGGYFRGASILLTGAPGTAKTTLCGAFAEAACLRGERTLFVSFDSATAEVVRNLSSVGINLGRHLAKGPRPGMLRMAYVRAVIGSAETQLLQIQTLAREHEARCVVIDPVSALAKAGQLGAGHGVAERLIDWTKIQGITMLCSSLLDASAPEQEGTPLQISTIADSWIHLSYLVYAGERNRGLSIIKSRGTSHSNQVRELLLSDTGITLADPYAAGGEVLMGTLRWEREQAEASALRQAERSGRQARAKLLAEEADIAARLAELQRELEAKRSDLQWLDETAERRRDAASGEHVSRLSLRGADADAKVPKTRSRAARKEAAS